MLTFRKKKKTKKKQTYKLKYFINSCMKWLVSCDVAFTRWWWDCEAAICSWFHNPNERLFFGQQTLSVVEVFGYGWNSFSLKLHAHLKIFSS